MATPAPPWTRDLVIYELNPRGFTSENGVGDGSGSGTFASLRARLPYLRDLGVNAIWLAGYCEATDHFFGIWSVYATTRPDRLDPVLGGPHEFRRLVESAHRCGIRMFLDVVSHGVVAESPLVAEHPDWFETSSWGMRDYDYQHPEFREWWVEVWTRYVREYEIDGFRVDVALGDRRLWDRITSAASGAGWPIVVFGEAEPYHFQQVSSHFEHGHEWNIAPGREHLPFEPPASRGYCRDIFSAYESIDDRYSTVEVSCHDAGWKCPPGNYYVVRGSRFRLGYGALLAPHIPIMFSGEEFDAEQASLPALTRDLYGGGGPGGWLYGSRLDWDGLEHPHRRTMLADARRLLEIRRENAELLNGDRLETAVTRVPGAPRGAPRPYACYRPGEMAIVVAGNDGERALGMSLNVPLEAMGLAGRRRYRLTELLTDRTWTADERDLLRMRITVPPDGTPSGGVRAIRIESGAQPVR